MRSSLLESRPSGELERPDSYPFTQSSPATQARMQSPQAQAVRPGVGSTQQYTQLASARPFEGWSPFILLAVAVYAVVASIMQAGWVENDTILLFSTAAGLVLGLSIAKAPRFPQSILHLAACLAGYWLSIWLTSAIASHIPWILLLQNMRDVIMGGLTSLQIPDSQEVFLFYLTFLSFFLGYFGVWLVYRAHMPWLVALVYCSIMLLNLSNARSDLSMTLVVLLGALLLLIGRMHLNNQLARWMQEGLHTDRSWLQNISGRSARITAVFALVALMFSLVLPVLQQPAAGISFWNVLNNDWNMITHGQLNLSNPGLLFQGGGASANFFDSQLPITGSVNLPTGQVLYYTSSNKQGQYLEAMSFDHFDGHTWTIGATNQVQQYDANVTMPLVVQGNVTPVTTTVTVVVPPQGAKPYIFAPDQPSSFSVPILLYTNGFTTAWTQQTSMTANEQYRVVSQEPVIVPQDISTIPLPLASPTSWSGDPSYMLLRNIYLQVPTNLSPTVLATAQKWTRTATNAYDAMQQLVAHLSDPNIFTYSINNQPIPANIDAVSQLLLTRRGFCTYYATAMTIMARQLGLPARIVSGFSPGQFDPARNIWQVNGDNAHSWVQVYFPGHGWINFDPTPGFSSGSAPVTKPTPVQTGTPTNPHPTVTPGHPTPGKQPTPSLGGSDTSANSAARQTFFLELSLTFLGISLLILLFAIYRYRERSFLEQKTLIAATFWRLSRLGRFSGITPRDSQTPYEYTRLLAERFPQAKTTLWHVAYLFVRERWGEPNQAPGPRDEQSLQQLWPRLRATMLRSLLIRKKERE